MDLRSKIRVIEGFPVEGISFKDITTLLKDGKGLRESVEVICDAVSHLEFDYVAGIEARGFIFAVPVAYRLGKGFIPVRKPGKLPGNILSKEYDLEYGSNTIEIDADALKPGDKVLLLDDLLATGGTAKAAIDLINETGAEVVAATFLIELEDLKGRDLFSDCETISIVKHDI